MRRLLLFLLLCGFTKVAFADSCTSSISITTASTQILPASDVVGGRHFLLVQNIGGDDAYCALGTSASTTSGFKLATTGAGSLLLQSYTAPNGVVIGVPTAQLNCAAAATSTVITVCDY